MPNTADGGVQNAVHQAVDVAFSLADLLGGLFSFTTKYTRTLASSEGEPTLQLMLDENNHYCPTFVNTSQTKVGVIHATQARAAESEVNGGVPLSSQVTYVQPQSTVAFPNFQNFTKGLLTACIVDPNSQAPLVPLAALTGRGMTASKGITLGSTALFDIDGTGITYQNNDPENNSHQPAFTVVTAPPNHTFTVGQVDIPAGTVQRIPFPEDITGQVISQLNAVLLGPPAALNTNVQRIGAGPPRRPSSSESFAPINQSR